MKGDITMKELKTIKLEEARKMSENRLQLEIGKHANYLRKELGMDKVESANFITSLLNLGASLQEKFDSKKSK